MIDSLDRGVSVPPLYRVFLNYPFDEAFEPLAYAMHFAVVAAGLVPRCALDITLPDNLRLRDLVSLITSCRFSIHDLSRYKGEGEKNFARFNMPIEMGMALYYTLSTEYREHRCLTIVETEHDYHRYASDLSGLDLKYHSNDDVLMLTTVFDWLRKVKAGRSGVIATAEVREKYQDFKETLERVKGSGGDNKPTHDEAQEVMYKKCLEYDWWDWRTNSVFKDIFPELPLTWKS